MPSKNSNYSSLISYCRHVTMETVKRLERGLNYNKKTAISGGSISGSD